MSDEIQFSFGDIAAVDPAGIPPRDFMLRDCYGSGLCQREQVSIIGGHGGGGKSALTIGMAIALASGKRFGPWVPTQEYRVLMINAEDDKNEQARRLDAALRSADVRGITRSDLGDRLMTLECPYINLITKNENTRKIEATDLYRSINTELAKRKVDFVFYDPLVEMSQGVNENDNGEMHNALKIIRYLTRQRSIHTCIVHHFRKGAGASDAGSVRGAGAVTALGRINMNIEKIEEKELKDYKGLEGEDPHRVLKLVVPKNNHGPTGSLHFFRIAPQTIANGEETVALEHIDGVTKSAVSVTPELVDRFLLRLHRGLISSGDRYSASSSGPLESRASGVLTSREFGLSKVAAGQLLRDLERDGVIESKTYQNHDRKSKVGYFVNKWPNGKPKGADVQQPIPF